MIYDNYIDELYDKMVAQSILYVQTNSIHNKQDRELHWTVMKILQQQRDILSNLQQVYIQHGLFDKIRAQGDCKRMGDMICNTYDPILLGQIQRLTEQEVCYEWQG